MLHFTAYGLRVTFKKELSPRSFPTRNKQALSVSNLPKLTKVKARLYFWVKNIMFLIFREYHLDFAIPYALINGRLLFKATKSCNKKRDERSLIFRAKLPAKLITNMGNNNKTSISFQNW